MASQAHEPDVGPDIDDGSTAAERDACVDQTANHGQHLRGQASGVPSLGTGPVSPCKIGVGKE